MRKVAVVGHGQRIQFPTDSGSEAVRSGEEPAFGADPVRDLTREFRCLLAGLVDLAPREGGLRLGNVAVRVIPHTDEDFSVDRRRNDEPLILVAKQILRGGVDAVRVVDEKRRVRQRTATPASRVWADSRRASADGNTVGASNDSTDE